MRTRRNGDDEKGIGGNETGNERVRRETGIRIRMSDKNTIRTSIRIGEI